MNFADKCDKICLSKNITCESSFVSLPFNNLNGKCIQVYEKEINIEEIETE
jgi:hypothetical protein